MKEVKLQPNQYKQISVRDLKANEYIKVKLHKGNKVFEKELTRKADGEKFKIYSVGVLHAGNEVYLAITPAMVKEFGNRQLMLCFMFKDFFFYCLSSIVYCH